MDYSDPAAIEDKDEVWQEVNERWEREVDDYQSLVEFQEKYSDDTVEIVNLGPRETADIRFLEGVGHYFQAQDFYQRAEDILDPEKNVSGQTEQPETLLLASQRSASSARYECFYPAVQEAKKAGADEMSGYVKKWISELDLFEDELADLKTEFRDRSSEESLPPNRGK